MAIIDTPELRITTPVQRGQNNRSVKQVQEWLTYHGFATGMDGDFGPATERTVQKFQDANHLPTTGIVNEAEWGLLIAPMVAALRPMSAGSMTLGELTVAYSGQHLQQHPVELGGDNRGPWVRLYCDGQDGVDYKWCAGFATFLVMQAAETLGEQSPLRRTLGCNDLAEDAREKGRLVRPGTSGFARVGPGSFFLLADGTGNFFHCGLVKVLAAEAFDTIEGNTNHDGSSNGYEAISRTRSYNRMSFAVV